MTDAAPLVERLGDAVLIRGAAVVETHLLVSRAIQKQARLDGIRPTPRLRELQAVLADTAAGIGSMSQTRHATSRVEPFLSESELTEPIGSQEAAKMTGLSVRQVQRLVSELDGHRLDSGAFVFERGAVVAFAASRKPQDIR